MKNPLDKWIAVRRDYAWQVDLGRFKDRHRYPGFFSRLIGSQSVTRFEDAFRRALDDDGAYVVAGEVCYWKNYGSYQSRDRLTTRLLLHLSDRALWTAFRNAVKAACAQPTLEAFRRLQGACDQPSGFATPLTFMAFYQPRRYPMVDKHIAFWWSQNRARYGFDDAPVFRQRNDGWIEITSGIKTRQNWAAYLAWARFCCDYAQRLGAWRARDVEMAVWTAQKQGLSLPKML